MSPSTALLLLSAVAIAGVLVLGVRYRERPRRARPAPPPECAATVAGWLRPGTAFTALADHRRVVLGVSPKALSVWLGRRLDLVEEIPLGRVDAVGPVRGGRRLRVTLADHATAEVVVRHRRDAAVFAAVFGRLRGDVPLRVLATLHDQDTMDAGALAAALHLGTEAVTAHLRDLVLDGLVADGYRITGQGRLAAAAWTRHARIAARPLAR